MPARVYFSAIDTNITGERDAPGLGTELWVTDGTPGGTRMVKDINANNDTLPIFRGSNPQSMVDLGDGRVMFRARDDLFGGRDELWVSDGTESGTFMVRNIGGGRSSEPSGLTALGDGRVVFAADDGRNAEAGHSGRELWISDGTFEGTVLLKDINPGVDDDGNALSSNPGDFLQLRPGQVIFTADDGIHGREVWVTNGTPEGTRLVADINPGSADGAPPIDTRHEDTLFHPLGRGQALFGGDDGIHGRELWITNGTAGGTRMLRDIREGADGNGVITYLTLPDGRVEVAAREAAGFFAQNIITDGTPAGTVTRTESHQTTQPAPGPVVFEMPSGGGWGVTSYSTFPMVALPGEKLLYTGTVVYEIDRGSGWAANRLLVTDGTIGGTDLLFGSADDDSIPGPAYTNLGMSILPDGRVAFAAETRFPREEALWITDGTASGTSLLNADLTSIGGTIWLDASSIMHVSTTTGGDRGIWITDLTAGSSTMVVDGATSFTILPADLPGGRFLMSAWMGADQGTDLWISNGTPSGTRLLSEDIRVNGMEQITALGRDKIVFAYNDTTHNREPWVMDLNTGAARMLADIAPGTLDSNPRGFTNVWTEGLPVPSSTLFTEFASMEGETPVIDLNTYFSDAGPLDYAIPDLPEGVDLDPSSGRVAATPDLAPGDYAVTVVANNDLGGATASAFDWSVVNTGQLVVNASNGWGREGPGGPIKAVPGGVIHIGHKAGLERLIRIEDAEASVENGILSVSGKLFSEQFDTDLPLMEGGFSIDMGTLAVSDFTDDAVEGSHSLVGGLIAMVFSDIVIATEGITLRTDLGFDGVLEALDTSGGLLALGIDADGPSFGLSALGTGRWFSDDALALPLPEGAPFGLEFSDLGIDYDLITDSAWFSGKAELTWGETVAKEYSFLSDSTTSKLTLDLAGDQDDPDSFFARGDKFLRIGRDGDGWTWDIVGEIKYEGQQGGTPAPGRPFIEEMSFSLDTVEKEFGGAFKGTMPTLFKGLTLEAEVGAGWDPAAIDSFAFGIDGLNKPLGTTGIFVQGGKLAAEGLAAQDPDEWPVLSADILMSLGPTPLSPLRGHIGGKIEGARVTLEMEAKTEVGYLLPGEVERIAQPMIRWLGVDADDVLEFELLSLGGSVMVDFARPTLSASVGANFLGDVITGQANFTTQMLSDEVILVNASVGASATFPEAIPLIGGLSRAGNGLAVFTSDGDNSNDFAAAWTSFSVPFYGEVSAGLRFWLDGRYERLGTDSIDAIGSWALGPAQDLVILSAQWDTPTDDARLELIAPDGTVLTEADFGPGTGQAGDIALVDDLSSPIGRHVALQAPVAGTWDLRLADETGRGEIRYDASEILQGPQATITDVSIDPGTRSGVIELDMDLGDAAQSGLSIFVSDSPDALSGLQVIDTVIPASEAGALSFDWDFSALASGVWWLHARTDADAMVPMVDMFATPIEVSGAADLSVTLEQEAAAGGASVLTVTVANAGDMASGAGRLELTAPEAVLNAPALPGAAPLTSAVSEIALPDIAPGESLRFDFALPSGLEVMTRPVMADVSSAVFDDDMDNNMAMLFLTPMQTDLTGTLTTRGGTLLAGAEVTATLPDGSSIDALSDALGTFTLAGLAPGAGHVDAALDHTRGVPPLTALDALEILRMAVGLTPSFGAPGPMDFIAADVNQDGRITALDALEVLRAAVGLQSDTGPEWVFVDSRTDLPAMTREAVAYDTGINLATHPADTPLDMTAILLGNMTDPM